MASNLEFGAHGGKAVVGDAQEAAAEGGAHVLHDGVEAGHEAVRVGLARSSAEDRPDPRAYPLYTMILYSRT